MQALHGRKKINQGTSGKGFTKIKTTKKASSGRNI